MSHGVSSKGQRNVGPATEQETVLDQKDHDSDAIRFCKVLLKHDRWRKAVKSQIRQQICRVIDGDAIVSIVLAYDVLVLFMQVTHRKLSFVDVDTGNVHSIVQRNSSVEYLPWCTGLLYTHARLLFPPNTNTREYLPNVGGLVETADIDMFMRRREGSEYTGDDLKIFEKTKILDFNPLRSDAYIDFPFCSEKREHSVRRIHFQFLFAEVAARPQPYLARNGSEWYDLVHSSRTQFACIRPGVQPFSVLIGDIQPAKIEPFQPTFWVKEIMLRFTPAGDALVETPCTKSWFPKGEFTRLVTITPYHQGFLFVVANGISYVDVSDSSAREVLFIDGHTITARDVDAKTSNVLYRMEPADDIRTLEGIMIPGISNVVSLVESTTFFISISGRYMLRVDSAHLPTGQCRVTELTSLKCTAGPTISMHVMH